MFDPIRRTVMSTLVIIGLDQGRDDSPVLCASIVSGEQSVFPVQSNGTD